MKVLVGASRNLSIPVRVGPAAAGDDSQVVLSPSAEIVLNIAEREYAHGSEGVTSHVSIETHRFHVDRASLASLMSDLSAVDSELSDLEVFISKIPGSSEVAVPPIAEAADAEPTEMSETTETETATEQVPAEADHDMSDEEMEAILGAELNQQTS